MNPAMSANQLAAKALQLRMKGKYEEAERFLKEAEEIKVRQDPGNESSRTPIDGTTSRFIMHDVSLRQMKKEEDADLILAKKIIHSHQYSVHGQTDEELDDCHDGPRRKIQKKGDGNHELSEINYSAKRILTQQERCQFCFENTSRPKHLVIAIENMTLTIYIMFLKYSQKSKSTASRIKQSIYIYIYMHYQRNNQSQ